MKVYFFCKFFGAIKISTKFMKGARFHDKNAIFVIWDKNYIFLDFYWYFVCRAQRVGFFYIGSGRVGYWTKYRVAGRVG